MIDSRVLGVAVATSILTVTGSLAWSSLDHRQDADKKAEEAETATVRAETAESYVARIDKDCEGRGALARALRSAGRCPDAERIVRDAPAEVVPIPGPAGPQGERGPRGLDGKDGAAGKPGPRGLPGKDGTDGQDGTNGQDGADGVDGQDGRSVESVTCDPDDHFVVHYDDGSQEILTDSDCRADQPTENPSSTETASP